MLDELSGARRQRLGALSGAGDCHFGRHDIARVITAYEGDFRTAVLERTTTPRRGRARAGVPAELALRQQWRCLGDLPIRRLRGEVQRLRPLSSRAMANITSRAWAWNFWKATLFPVRLLSSSV